MARLKKVCPFLPAGEDVARTLSFYEQKLGFTRQWQDSDQPELAVIARDEIELFLQRNGDVALAEWTTLRVEVQGVEKLYQEFVDRDPQMIHPNGVLEKKPWGSTDFSILDPNGVCITFYEF